MAQPDYQRLSQCFTGAAEECARLPNIPAVNNGQEILESIRELRESIRELRHEMRQTATQQIAGVASLAARLDARLDASDANNIARIHNATVNNCQTPLHPLRDRNNQLVPEFPANGEALSNLSRADLTTLLRAFNQPADGGIDDKRQRLGEFIGIVVVQVY